MENQPMLDLVFRVRFRWKLWPRQITGDTTYGTIDNIVAVEDQHMRAYVPLPDFDKRTSVYGKKAFRYDPEQDVYMCPNNAILPLHTHAYNAREKRYQGDAATCNACLLKAQCTTSDQGRLLKRSFDEEYLEQVRAYHATEPYQKAMRKRSMWVEPLFAEGKQWHGMRRFRLRHLWRVNIEGLLIASGQNLKRLLKKRGWGRRPFPAEGLCALFLAAFGWSTSTCMGCWSFSSRMPRITHREVAIVCGNTSGGLAKTARIGTATKSDGYGLAGTRCNRANQDCNGRQRVLQLIRAPCIYDGRSSQLGLPMIIAPGLFDPSGINKRACHRFPPGLLYEWHPVRA
jgi:Transposase DDE domain